MSKDESKSLRWICLCASTLAFLLPVSLHAQPPKKEEAAIVVCSTVVSTSQTDQQSFLGSVEPIRRSTIGSAVDGRVLKVQFDIGDPVGGSVNETSEFLGQPLVQLRTQTLDIEIRTAELQVKKREQELEELTTSMPRDLELASATLAGTKAQAAYSRGNFERLQKMSGSRGAVSATELEEARSAYTADNEAMKAAAADLAKLDSTKAVRLKQAENLLETARQEIARLQDLKVKYTIRAPFPGFVTQKFTDVGAWVSRGEPLVEVVQLDPIEMVVNVPQKYIGRIQESLANTEEPFETELSFDSVERTLTGTILRVVPQADLKTRSFPVRIRLENPKLGDSHLLKPGMLGRAQVGIGTAVQMLMIKKDALVLGGNTQRVFKIVKRDGNETAVPLNVKTGASVGNWIEVTGDLEAGDLVVVEGNERLRPNQAVKVVDILQETVK
jgi:RND family efflux transporter MFP subunit